MIKPFYTKSQKGFTLIELMITIAVVAILAVIAIPAYDSVIRKSARKEAQAVLMELTQFMERNFTTNNCYHRRDGRCNLAWNGTAAGAVSLPYTKSPIQGSSSFYTIRFQGNPSSTSYTISAVPQGSQIRDDCGTLTINHMGVRTPAQDGCW